MATYREAIAREPNFPEAYNNLGNALREAGRPDEAIACYTACIQLQLQRPGAAPAGVRSALACAPGAPGSPCFTTFAMKQLRILALLLPAAAPGHV